MGVNYSQYAVYGVRLEKDDIETVIVPDVYDEQPRYNTKTGKETHKEKVLVRSALKTYKFLGVEKENVHELSYAIPDKYPDLCAILNGYYNDDDVLYVGTRVSFEESNFGRIDMLEGELSFDKLREIHDSLREIITPGIAKELSLHLFYNVG